MIRNIVLLLCIVTGAVYLRTVFTRGITEYDEAYYLLENRGIHDVISGVGGWIHGGSSRLEQREEIRNRGGIFPPGKPMPVFSALAAVWSLLPMADDAAIRLLMFLLTALTAYVLWHVCRDIHLSPEDSAFAIGLFWLS